MNELGGKDEATALSFSERHAARQLDSLRSRQAQPDHRVSVASQPDHRVSRERDEPLALLNSSGDRHLDAMARDVFDQHSQ